MTTYFDINGGFKIDYGHLTMFLWVKDECISTNWFLSFGQTQQTVDHTTTQFVGRPDTRKIHHLPASNGRILYFRLTEEQGGGQPLDPGAFQLVYQSSYIIKSISLTI
jgi:hypothetical protein